MNREFSTKIITELLRWGVDEFYLCAGVRNIALIETISNIITPKKIVFNHFEERSAGFYALGRIKSLKKPVVVVTTSGTAVGELLPSVMEAYYCGLPLVVLSADRPRSYRGTGAPQSAEQNNIFGIYVSKCFDLDINDDFNLSHILQNKPLHINVCFSTPLQNGNLVPIPKPKPYNLCREAVPAPSQNDITALDKFIKNNKKILVIVSQIYQEEKEDLINFLVKLNAPIYLEAISNLRENPKLSHLQILCADKIWLHSKKSNYEFSAVLKIGGTPTHRIWRDLDETRSDIPVFSLAENVFSGIPNAQHITCNFDHFFANYVVPCSVEKNLWAQFKQYDKIFYEKMTHLFYKYPNAEQSFFFHLSKKIPPKAKVYLGTSLPIRYWDLAADYEDKSSHFNASRGLCGIDGVLSCFLGFAEENKENWGVFGDLTTLYDLAAPWMLQQRPLLKVNICVMNNGGGRIFKKVLSGPLALLTQNIHEIHFEHWAKLWNIKYEKVKSNEELFLVKSSENNIIIEIVPDAAQTEEFSNEYDLI